MSTPGFCSTPAYKGKGQSVPSALGQSVKDGQVLPRGPKWWQQRLVGDLKGLWIWPGLKGPVTFLWSGFGKEGSISSQLLYSITTRLPYRVDFLVFWPPCLQTPFPLGGRPPCVRPHHPLLKLQGPADPSLQPWQVGQGHITWAQPSGCSSPGL